MRIFLYERLRLFNVYPRDSMLILTSYILRLKLPS